MRESGAMLHGGALTVGAIPAAFLLVAWLAAAPPACAGPKWPPITDEDRAANAPSVDPAAGAEDLLWTIHIDYEANLPSIHAFVRHEIRTKVFNAAGAQEASTVRIRHEKGIRLGNIAARTIRPDGSIVELTKDQIFVRNEERTADDQASVTSLTLPAVTPGTILDYRWTEMRYDSDVDVVYLFLQRAHPVRRAELYLKPLPLLDTDLRFKMRSYNMPTPRFEDAGEYQKAALTSIDAYSVEDYMPPRRQASPWAVFYFTRGEDPTPETLYGDYVESILKDAEPTLAWDKTVSAAAREIVGESGTPDAKADRICDWLRSHVDAIDDDRLGLSESDRAKEPNNRTAADTLRRRRGDAADLLHLFIAMCRSVGVPAKMVAAADRSEVFFDQRLNLPWLLDKQCAAVPVPGGWRFYAPDQRWARPGRMHWSLEGVEALVLDRSKPQFVRTPLAPPDSSLLVRSARLRIRPDGGAEGEFVAEATGHIDAKRHEAYDDVKPEARAEYCRTHFPANFPPAQLESIAVEGADDPMSRVVERGTIRLANYAEVVGDRLLVPLALFSAREKATFSSPTRKNAIYFPYPWDERDTVRIELPEGYEIEDLPAPEPIVGKGVARYHAETLASMDGRSILFLREFSFGEGDAIYFPADQYAGIKKLFDAILQRDQATVSLRRTR